MYISPSLLHPSHTHSPIHLNAIRNKVTREQAYVYVHDVPQRHPPEDRVGQRDEEQSDVRGDGLLYISVWRRVVYEYRVSI